MKKNKVIKLVVATGIYPPSIGGPATYSKLLYDTLPQRGIKVTIATFDTVRKYPKVISHILYIFLLYKKAMRADIIYAQDPTSVGLPACIVSFLLRKKFILKVVGDFAWEQGASRFGVTNTLDEFVKQKQKHRYVRFLQHIESKVAEKAHAIVVPSLYLKGVVSTWNNVSPEKIKVIYNAFNPPFLENIPEGNDRNTRIISVGRLVPWKGFEKVIKAVAMLHNDGVSVTLDIAGSGPLEEDLKKAIKDNDAESYVTMCGALPQKKLHQKIAESDIFVLYTGYEGFSHLILEVMALKIPVITTKMGGNVEIIKSGENGILIPYDQDVNIIKESIQNMIDNKDVRMSIVKKAQDTISNYSEEKMLGELSNLIKETV